MVGIGNPRDGDGAGSTNPKVPSTKAVTPRLSSGLLILDPDMSPDRAKEKCKNFLSFLLQLSAKRDETVGRNVHSLIQSLIDGKVNAEDFSERLQKEVGSQPQECLAGFLKKSLPPLRQALANKELTIDGIRPPSISSTAIVPPSQPIVSTPVGKRELSDSDSDEPIKRKRFNDEELHNSSQLQKPEENDSLRSQLEALKNEVDLMKAQLEPKDAEIIILQDLPSGSRGLNPVSPSQSVSDDERGSIDATNNLLLRTETNRESESDSSRQPSTSGSIKPLEAKMVGVISTFLHTHPFGANLDYIASFVQKVLPKVTLLEIQSLLLSFPGIFREELFGVGANLERKWFFTGFSTDES